MRGIAGRLASVGLLCSLGALAACGDDGTTTDGSGASGNTGNTGATGGDGGSSGGTGNIGNTGGTGNIGNTGGVGNQGGTGNEGGSPPMCETGSDCNDNNLCTTDTCPAGTCVNTAVDPNDNDPCTTDTCDPTTGIANTPIDPDDMDQCTLDACRGVGVTNVQSVSLFSESFDNNNAGWTLGTEWGIGPAAAGGGTTGLFGGWLSGADPAADGSGTAAGGLAGVVIGGNYAPAPQHPYYYLTSPVINAAVTQGNVVLSFQRWLGSDYPAFVTNVVEAYDGAAWQVVWQQPSNGQFLADGAPDGSGWLPVEYDLTALANANLQVRFGFKIESGNVVALGGWSIDNVQIINRPTAADNDICTTDSCDSVAGSVYTSVSVADAVACTVDSCDSAVGIKHVPSNAACGDGSACTTDVCDPTTGCINTPIVCNDNNACTTNSCNPATGCVYTPIVCNDNNACTVDGCNTVTGCTAALPTQPHNKCNAGPLNTPFTNTVGCTTGNQGVISQVCADDPYCCNTDWDGICVGETLCFVQPGINSATCDATYVSCVQQICAADPYCCNNTWDSLCIADLDTASNCASIAPTCP